ncbi:MAG: OmpH family outer membrane protein [Rickettsiales bacterium]|nr:OmpH family outer membrane protein [Rickettsiales bacterium]
MSFIRLFIACLLLILCTAVSTVVPAIADDAVKSQIAIVNIKQILNDSKASKHIASEVEKKRKEYQKKVEKEETALRKEEEELSKQRTALSNEAFEKKAVEFKKKVTEFQHRVQSRRAKLENGYTKALGEIQKTVFEITEELAKEKGFLVALPKSQVLFAVDALEISDKVLEELDDRLPKVDVDIEE